MGCWETDRAFLLTRRFSGAGAMLRIACSLCKHAFRILFAWRGIRLTSEASGSAWRSGAGFVDSSDENESSPSGSSDTSTAEDF
jgi:hypothetical protein